MTFVPQEKPKNWQSIPPGTEQVFIAWLPVGTWKLCKLREVLKKHIIIETPNGGIMKVEILDAVRLAKDLNDSYGALHW